MKKLLPLVIFILALSACGGSQEFQNVSPFAVDIANRTNDLLKKGIVVDPYQVIKGQWSMYHVTPTDDQPIQEKDNRLIIFDQVVTIAAGPERKFDAPPFINLPISTDFIKNYKNDCEKRSLNYFSTTVDNGTYIYNFMYDITTTYEIVKEGEKTNLVFTFTGRQYNLCCETEANSCNSVDFTGPTIQKTNKFLIAASANEGFVLQIYDGKGVPYNDFISFMDKK